MPRSVVDDFLDGLLEYAREFAQERIDEVIPKPPRQPRRKNIKPPKVKTPKTPKPAKREAQGPTLYQVLGVDAKCEPEVIEAAWKAKARLYHPDHNANAKTIERMKAVNSAHDVLKNPETRAAYDRELKREAK